MPTFTFGQFDQKFEQYKSNKAEKNLFVPLGWEIVWSHSKKGR